jgi:hypothetical protein
MIARSDWVGRVGRDGAGAGGVGISPGSLLQAVAELEALLPMRAEVPLPGRRAPLPEVLAGLRELGAHLERPIGRR